MADDSAIFEAAKENSVAVLSKLIQESENSLVDAVEFPGKTLICSAIENNSVDVVKWLIENGCLLCYCCQCCASTADGHQMKQYENSPVQLSSPLLAAVAQNSLEMAAVIVESGRVHVDEPYKNITPLIKACVDNLPKMVSLLLNHGADVNGRQISDADLDLDTENPREWEHRPLYHAVENCHGDIVELLANRGARYIPLCPLPCHSFSFWGAQNTQMQRCWGSILELAVIKFCPKVEFLMDFYRDMISCEDAYYALVLGVRAQKMDTVRLLLDKYYRRPDGNIPGRKSLSNNYWMVIRLAVRECKEDETIPRLLLDRFGVMLADDSDRSRIISLLFVAALRNLPQTVAEIGSILTRHFDIAALKASPSAGILLRDVRCMALYQGNLKILQTLYDADLLDLEAFPEAPLGVLACQRTGTGATVLAALRWLMDLGFDPRQCRVGHVQPIQAAVKQRLPEAVDALCQLGVDANCQLHSKEGLSLLHFHMDLCVQQLGMVPHVALIDQLVGHGADLARLNAYGYTPLSVLFWLMENEFKKDGDEGQQCVISPHYRMNGDRTIFSAFHPVEPLPLRDSAARPDWGVDGSDDEDESYGGEFHDVNTTTAAVRPPFSYNHGRSMASNRARFPVCFVPDLPNRDIPDESPGDSLPAGASNDLPHLLSVDSRRTFVKTIASKFGTRLLSMGASTLVGEENWHVVDKHLHGVGIAWRHVPSLKTCCWIRVRHSLGGLNFQSKLSTLPLPDSIKQYLKKL